MECWLSYWQIHILFHHVLWWHLLFYFWLNNFAWSVAGRRMRREKLGPIEVANKSALSLNSSDSFGWKRYFGQFSVCEKNGDRRKWGGSKLFAMKRHKEAVALLERCSEFSFQALEFSAVGQVVTLLYIAEQKAGNHDRWKETMLLRRWTCPVEYRAVLSDRMTSGTNLRCLRHSDYEIWLSFDTTSKEDRVSKFIP